MKVINSKTPATPGPKYDEYIYNLIKQ